MRAAVRSRRRFEKRSCARDTTGTDGPGRGAWNACNRSHQEGACPGPTHGTRPDPYRPLARAHAAPRALVTDTEERQPVEGVWRHQYAGAELVWCTRALI